MATKVVVTGGAGFIGTHMCESLRKEGYSVVSVDLKTGDDVRDTEKMKKIFEGAQYVFHLAALPRVQYSIEHPQETHDTNVNGTLSVLTAAKDAGVKKVVYSASSSAYGDQDKMPLVENMEARPKSPYGLQKYIGELYCRLWSEIYDLPTVSLRYFNVYGPGASDDGAYALVIAKFLKQRREDKPMTITGDGKQTRDYTHVSDVVRANIMAAESPFAKGEVFNIGGGNNISVNRVAELIGGPVEYIPARLEPHDTLADIMLAKGFLNWEPQIKFEDGITELKRLSNLA